jgi:hypothetical protein
MEPIWFAVTAVIRIQKESDPKQIDPDEMKMASIEVSDIVWGGRLIVPRWIFSLVYMVRISSVYTEAFSREGWKKYGASCVTRFTKKHSPAGRNLTGTAHIYVYIVCV